MAWGTTFIIISWGKRTIIFVKLNTSIYNVSQFTTKNKYIFWAAAIVAPDSESEEGEVSTDGWIEERVPDAVVILCPFTPEESVHLSRESSVVAPVCTCGPEIPPQIASDSEGSTLIKNEEPIPVPGPVTTGQCAVHSGPRDSSPAQHTHTIYHPYRRRYGSEPLGCRRRTPRPGLEGRGSKALERGVSVAF